jgi:hypothetical protein
MLFIPQMKTKQIPDNFRDWIEARTFEIGADIALPPPDYLKRILVPKLAGGSPIEESRLKRAIRKLKSTSLDLLPKMNCRGRW